MSDQGVLDGLKTQFGDYAKALGRKAVSSASDQVDKISDRFEGGGNSDGGGSMQEGAKAGAAKIAEGGSPAKAAFSAATATAKDKVKGVFGGGSSSGGGGTDNKFMNIVEWTDVGVPLKVAYNAFTQFEDWPDFMKKVENVERVDDVKLKFKGQVFLSHRTWESTITEQVADSHIVWESTGEKGHISGSVSFHEVTPTLTRMLTIGEYHPQGFVERTGNLWRAVGRRFRLELKFFVHHVMTEVILDQDSVEGWRGEIRDGEVVTSHEDALEQEEQEAQEQEDAQAEEEENASSDESAEETDEEVEPEAEEGEYEDEAPAEEEEEYEDEAPADEEEAPAEEEEEYEDEAPADEEEAPADEEEAPAEEEEEYEDEAPADEEEAPAEEEEEYEEEAPAEAEEAPVEEDEEPEETDR